MFSHSCPGFTVASPVQDSGLSALLTWTLMILSKVAFAPKVLNQICNIYNMSLSSSWCTSKQRCITNSYPCLCTQQNTVRVLTQDKKLQLLNYQQYYLKQLRGVIFLLTHWTNTVYWKYGLWWHSRILSWKIFILSVHSPKANCH